MNEKQCLSKMIAPSTPRPSIWRRGIIQVHLTRACDMQCFGCTQGSNLRGKPVMITVDEFEEAMISLKGYWGVIGLFGGNPATHPKFDEICVLFRKYIRKEQRGLWCNHPRGKGAVIRKTFDPRVSNLNVHLSQEAWDEFAETWPECERYLKGLEQDSRHSPPFVAMKDVIPNEATRWKLISNCDINKYWSAMLCSVPGRGLRAFFCELAGAQAMLHAHDPTWPDTGMVPVKGWWKRPMKDFAEQVRVHCHSCGVPLRRFGQLAVDGEYEEVSKTHQDVYLPKDKDREVRLVQLDAGKKLKRVTDYVENGGL